MIRQESFTKEWIDKVSMELNYKDKNLIEKVIRALALLEMSLPEFGCPLSHRLYRCTGTVQAVQDLSFVPSQRVSENPTPFESISY